MGNKPGTILGRTRSVEGGGRVIQKDIKSFRSVMSGGVDKWRDESSRQN